MSKSSCIYDSAALGMTRAPKRRGHAFVHQPRFAGHDDGVVLLPRPAGRWRQPSDVLGVELAHELANFKPPEAISACAAS